MRHARISQGEDMAVTSGVGVREEHALHYASMHVGTVMGCSLLEQQVSLG
jgi:hypothetical protein